jgi:hypothetical protein
MVGSVSISRIDVRVGMNTRSEHRAALRAESSLRPAVSMNTKSTPPDLAVSMVCFKRGTWAETTAGLSSARRPFHGGGRLRVEVNDCGGVSGTSGSATSRLAISVMTVARGLHPLHAEGLSGYWGVSARNGTPTEIIERLSKEINESVNGQRLNSRITELGDVPFAAPASEFGTYVAQFTERWGKTLREAGIKAS